MSSSIQTTRRDEDSFIENLPSLRATRRKCKHCGKEISRNHFSLKSFCSYECRDDYSRFYNTLWQSQKKRKTTTTSHSAEIKSITTHKIKISPEQISNSVTLFENYGGKRWYSLAKKHCCNFYVRSREGYCVTLAEPYHRFECKCSKCFLGVALADKYGLRKNSSTNEWEEKEQTMIGYR